MSFRCYLYTHNFYQFRNVKTLPLRVCRFGLYILSSNESNWQQILEIDNIFISLLYHHNVRLNIWQVQNLRLQK